MTLNNGKRTTSDHFKDETIFLNINLVEELKFIKINSLLYGKFLSYIFARLCTFFLLQNARHNQSIIFHHNQGFKFGPANSRFNPSRQVDFLVIYFLLFLQGSIPDQPEKGKPLKKLWKKPITHRLSTLKHLLTIATKNTYLVQLHTKLLQLNIH